MRAQQRRLVMDADRLVRDESIDQAATKYIRLSDEREALRKKVAEVEHQMGAPMRDLFALGLSQRRVALLLDLSVEEVRRLRLATEAPAHAVASEVGDV